MIKKLIVSGCSFTENQGSWAYNLAERYDLELVNLAWPGAGNSHVAWSLISYLERNQKNLDECMIGIMWTHPIRKDFIFEINPLYKDQEMYTYNYDQYNRLVMLGDMVKKYDFFSSRLVKQELIKEELGGRGNKSAITFTDWFTKINLVSYLLRKNINFFQTMFHNYFTESDLLVNKTNWHWQQIYRYLEELEKLDLKPELTNWIDLHSKEYLGEYAYHNNLLCEDNYHPSKDGHKKWTEEILIPKLLSMKILNSSN